MQVRIAQLTEATVEDAPEWGTHPYSCKYCIYWEFPDECKEPAEETKERCIRRKTDWLRNTRKLFGSCGKLVYADDVAVGYAQYAPSAFLRRSMDYSAGPASSDAVLICCLYFPSQQFRGVGLGRKLLQSIIDELRRRGYAAVETFARKGSADNPSGPVEFYLRNGFRIHRDDREFPLLRLDL
jgi:GNAT superfamily N-acetyltransferase